MCGALCGTIRKQNNKSWQRQTEWIIAGVMHTHTHNLFTSSISLRTFTDIIHSFALYPDFNIIIIIIITFRIHGCRRSVPDQNKYVLPRVTVFVFIHKTEHNKLLDTDSSMTER